jgi:hypothetical protein
MRAAKTKYAVGVLMLGLIAAYLVRRESSAQTTRVVSASAEGEGDPSPYPPMMIGPAVVNNKTGYEITFFNEQKIYIYGEDGQCLRGFQAQAKPGMPLVPLACAK